METFRFEDLRRRGEEPRQIWGRSLAGGLDRVRHGGYATSGQCHGSEDDYRALLATTIPLLKPDSVLSHASAGVLWGLPVPRRMLTKVHVTRPQVSGGSIRRWLHTHSWLLAEHELTRIEGVAVTSLARTAVDLACQASGPEGLAIMDAAWRASSSAVDLVAQIDGCSKRRGIAQARWALANANPLAESPGESVSRYWMIRHDLPAPSLQYEVRDTSGRLLGRTDFAWPEQHVVGEFDGRIKYEPGLVPDGMSAADVVVAEKRRENLLRAEGWWVMRWMWSDLQDPLTFTDALKDALARGVRPGAA